jgi:uncharacterized protein (DUF488 family)
LNIFTIGFSQKSAKEFFELLKDNGVETLVDARLNNKSQLAGFTKGKDLPYFLKEIANIEYVHELLLAPTKELLDGYKNKVISWEAYVKTYEHILKDRHLEDVIDKSLYDNACILCSEPTADKCHRRLAAEYIQRAFPSKKIIITHL